MYSILRNIETSNAPSISSERWNSGRMAKAILLLGIPLIVGELGSIAQQFADTMMVGHYGTKELAAAGFVNSIFYYVIFLTLGMSYASTPLVGNAFGRKDYKGVFRIFLESTIVNLLVGLFFVTLLLIVYFNLEGLFFNQNSEFFHQPFEILDISKGYMLMLIASIPFLTLFYACKQYLDGIGNTKISMWILLFSNVLNIGLNWLLIFGHYRFPALGLLGAGVSTLVSRIVQLVLISWFVYKTKSVNSHFTKLTDKEIKPTYNGVKSQFKLGLPISLQLGLEIGAFNICGIFMGWLGALPLAAHQAMYTISTLFFQVLYGIGAAGTILISQFYSIKAWMNIRQAAKTAFFIGLASVTIISLIVCLFFEPIAFFFTDDSSVVEYMKLILPCLIVYQLGDCTQIIYANAIRGLEDTKPLAFGAIFSYIVICVPICYWFAFGHGWPWDPVAGVWGGIPIGLSLAGIIFYMRFRMKLRALSTKK